MAGHIRAGLNTDVPPDYRRLFDHVYAQPTAQLQEQSAVVADELERDTTDPEADQ
jgi:2-oxoisovalerate dehydrogenase E1 component alpha subunit